MKILRKNARASRPMLDAVLLLCLAGLPLKAESSSRHVITEFGAKGDGRTLNTAAINRAIRACHDAGGGMVWVPDGADLPRVRSLTELGTREARQAFWAHELNSGCAGHTYGASGIFQINRPDWKFGQAFSGLDWGQLPWRDAMHLPGSRQIGLGAALLRSLPWHEMAPATNGFKGSTAAAITPDAEHAMAFTHSGKAITVTLDRFPGVVSARWFDPTTGDTRAASAAPLSPRGEHTFTPPGKNAAGDADWVLVIQAE